jgi:hypothetical protein
MERREFDELKRQWWARNPPLKHQDHPRPVTRRQMLAQGFIASAAMVASPSIFGLLGRKNDALAQFVCSGAGAGGTVPFICVDLGGGANLAASNVLVGGPLGQLDLLSDNGYETLGLPANQRPQIVGSDASMGILFHPDSALLKGITAMASATTLAQCEGSVVCARSDNDTQNNPHNPMYGINKAGANGALVPLVGTRNSDSGGRSVAPMNQIDLTVRPVRTSDPDQAMGLVDLNADLANNKFESTATVMKMVLDGFAGAGCVSFGGYDYHGGGRVEGEGKDFEAGQAIGAMLEYAAATTTPLMIYIFSDGSVSSNGQIDNTADQTVNGRTVPGGGGKGEWVSDNSGRSSSLYLVYDPTVTAVRPPLRGGDLLHRQMGFFRQQGSIETSALQISDNVDALTESVVLNYLAIHGRESELDTVLPGHTLGTPAQREALISFDKLAAVP